MSKRARVLVIDDDPLFRSLITSLLRKDYFVSVAADGSEGFYKALEHQPTVAVVDVKMPGWDGLKTLKAFRRHPLLKSVKVVMLTSDASKDTVLAAIHGGANDYMIKTAFSKEEFYEKLNKLLPEKRKRPGRLAPHPPDNHQPPGSHAAAESAGSGPQPRPASQHPHCDAGAKACQQNRHEQQAALQEVIDGWE